MAKSAFKQEEGCLYYQNGLGTEEETGKMPHLECSFI
jgi:hypothetical protein